MRIPDEQLEAAAEQYLDLQSMVREGMAIDKWSPFDRFVKEFVPIDEHLPADSGRDYGQIAACHYLHFGRKAWPGWRRWVRRWLSL